MSTLARGAKFGQLKEEEHATFGKGRTAPILCRLPYQHYPFCLPCPPYLDPDLDRRSKPPLPCASQRHMMHPSLHRHHR